VQVKESNMFQCEKSKASHTQSPFILEFWELSLYLYYKSNFDFISINK